MNAETLLVWLNEHNFEGNDVGILVLNNTK